MSQESYQIKVYKVFLRVESQKKSQKKQKEFWSIKGGSDLNI